MMFGRKFFFGVSVLLLGSHLARGASIPVPTSNAEGQALAAELRSMKPEENLQVNGVIRIQDADGKRTRIPFHYQFISGEKVWHNVYETKPDGHVAAEKLVIVHTEGQPNRYLHSRASGADGPVAEPVALTGDQAMAPFANSDFWLADLGLEFLHWPEQRIVEEAHIRMRKGRPCKVLESINSTPGAAGYTRVRSWIDTEKKQPILAEAYGPDNKRIKEFEIGSVTKVNGQWQLKNMEMRDTKKDSRTVLEFKYEQKEEE
jgi:Outer membrane lipoprotein-sorting protein